VAIYFVNGIYKLQGGDWRSGEVMHYVLANVAWTRFAYADLPLPPGTALAMTWTTLVWELGFPLLILVPKLRAPTLWLGVLFHLGTATLLPLGLFPAYMLCLYLPLVPWEKVGRSGPERPACRWTRFCQCWSAKGLADRLSPRLRAQAGG
jgi:hypothetical protein